MTRASSCRVAAAKACSASRDGAGEGAAPRQRSIVRVRGSSELARATACQQRRRAASGPPRAARPGGGDRAVARVCATAASSFASSAVKRTTRAGARGAPDDAGAPGLREGSPGRGARSGSERVREKPIEAVERRGGPLRGGACARRLPRARGSASRASDGAPAGVATEYVPGGTGAQRIARRASARRRRDGARSSGRRHGRRLRPAPRRRSRRRRLAAVPLRRDEARMRDRLVGGRGQAEASSRPARPTKGDPAPAPPRARRARARRSRPARARSDVVPASSASVSSGSAAKARAARSARRRACASGDSPGCAGPWASTPMPSVATNGSTCASPAVAATPSTPRPSRRAAPDPASPAASASVPHGDATRTHVSPWPRSTRVRASTAGACQAIVARSISAAKDVAGGGRAGRLAWRRDADDEPERRSSAVPARRPASVHQAARSAASRGSGARVASARPRSGGGVVSASSTATSCRASAADRRDARRGGRSQVARRSCRAWPRGTPRRREPSPRPTARARAHRARRGATPADRAGRPEPGAAATACSGGRRPRRHHDARSARRDLSRRVVHDGARVVRGGRARARSATAAGHAGACASAPAAASARARPPPLRTRLSPTPNAARRHASSSAAPGGRRRHPCRTPRPCTLPRRRCARSGSGRRASAPTLRATASSAGSPSATGREHRLADPFHDARCLGGRRHERAQSQAAPARRPRSRR